jgi:hypothetical protein
MRNVEVSSRSVQRSREATEAGTAVLSEDVRTLDDNTTPTAEEEPVAARFEQTPVSNIFRGGREIFTFWLAPLGAFSARLARARARPSKKNNVRRPAQALGRRGKEFGE